MGGRQKYFIKEWENIIKDQWVLSVLKHGYKLEFPKLPSSTGIKRTRANEKDTIILLKAVEKLLQKGAIEPVLFAEFTGFVQYMFF